MWHWRIIGERNWHRPGNEEGMAICSISPQIDMIVIQMDGDVARKEKEVHCRCATVECEHKGKVHPLGCETLIDGSCPVDIPCKDHENTLIWKILRR